MDALDVLIDNIVRSVLNPIILLLFVLGFAIFVWGAVEFLWNSSSDAGKDTGKKHMLWGVIGMFIMASVRGIIAIVEGTFGL